MIIKSIFIAVAINVSLFANTIPQNLINSYELIKDSQTCIQESDGTSTKREFKITQDTLNVTTKHFLDIDCNQKSFSFSKVQKFLYKTSSSPTIYNNNRVFDMDLTLIDETIIEKNGAQSSASYNLKLFTKFYIKEKKLYIATPKSDKYSSFLLDNEYLSSK
jgi:hypothetical protein